MSMLHIHGFHLDGRVTTRFRIAIRDAVTLELVYVYVEFSGVVEFGQLGIGGLRADQVAHIEEYVADDDEWKFVGNVAKPTEWMQFTEAACHEEVAELNQGGWTQWTV